MDEIYRHLTTIGRGMWQRRWIGLAVAWVIAVIGAIVLWRIPDRYEATARVYVDTQTLLKPLLSGLAVQPDIEEQIGLLARTLITRPNVEKIMRTVDLDVGADSQAERDRIAEDVTRRLKFFGVGRENTYNIAFQDTSPERARKVVQAVLSLFVESGLGNKRRDAEAARRFIDEQIKGYEKKLEEAENRVKEFKLRNLGFIGGAGQDYFSRMSATNDELAKVRLELRAAEQSRDALKRELLGEEPSLLPDPTSLGVGGSGSEYDARIDLQRKQLDEMLRRFTEEHPDVIATRRLIDQLEADKKRELDARRAAASKAGRLPSSSTNPVFQQIKIALAESEANIASLTARVRELEARLAQFRASASRAPQIEAEMAQLNRDYDVMQKNYEQLVSRRESASLSEDVDSAAGLAEFRVVEPPRVSPKAVFPNRLALVPLVLAAALFGGLAAAYGVSQLFPTFHGVRNLRDTTRRPVLGSVSLQTTSESLRRRRKADMAFAGGLMSLFLIYGAWIGWVSLAARG
jgi:polysaccharide chain length determinant protein (PEP-CTERM system associated)